MEASNIGASVEGAGIPGGSSLSPSVGPPLPPSEAPWGKRTLRKVAISRPSCRLSPPAPKRRKVEVMPKKLQRSGESASSSAHPSSPEIIKLDE